MKSNDKFSIHIWERNEKTGLIGKSSGYVETDDGSAQVFSIADALETRDKLNLEVFDRYYQAIPVVHNN